MKNKLYRLLMALGFSAFIALFFAPGAVTAAEADTDMQFNQFRIKTAATGDVALWGQDYMLDDDGVSSERSERSVPASIACYDTVYIQADMFSQIYNKVIYDIDLRRGYKGIILMNGGYNTIENFEIPLDDGKYVLADGRPVPFTISYGNAMYIQADALGKIFNNTLLWNGDSSTITFWDYDPSASDEGVTILDDIEMPDANGNVWKYSVVKRIYDRATEYFMLISDETRGYSRVYRIADENAYEFTGDRVYLIKFEKGRRDPRDPEKLKFCMILFANTNDNQDGSEFIVDVSGFRSYTRYAFVNNGIGYYTVNGNPPGGPTPSSLYSLDFETGIKTDLILYSDNTIQILEKVEGGYIYYEADSKPYGNRMTPIDMREINKYKIKADGTEEVIDLGAVE